MCENCNTVTLWVNSQTDGGTVCMYYHAACPWQRTSTWLLRHRLEKANSFLPLSTGDKHFYTMAVACVSFFVSLSYFLSAVHPAGCNVSLLLYCEESLDLCWASHRCRQGAQSDLLEEDLNSVLFNVFLGRLTSSRWRWCGWCLTCE